MQKYDAVKLLGGCFSDLSIQDERVLSDVAGERADPISVKPCVGEQTFIADRMTDDAPEPWPTVARSDYMWECAFIYRHVYIYIYIYTSDYCGLLLLLGWCFYIG